jgi:hypothetical protein
MVRPELRTLAASKSQEQTGACAQDRRSSGPSGRRARDPNGGAYPEHFAMPDNPFRCALARCTALANRLAPDPRGRFWLATAIKLAAIPYLMLLCLVVHAESLNAIAQILPLSESVGPTRVYGTIFAHDFIAACAVAIVFCYPLAMLYRKFSVGVAVLVGLPVLALICPHPSDYSMARRLVPAVYGVLSFAVPLILGTWLARAQLLRRAKGEATHSGRAAR